ncbi:MAG: restriction endonuclease, partial [Saprospiraceae bacterium]|nr:restriction endonuclease [Saprospiraceae bacterium]
MKLSEHVEHIRQLIDQAFRNRLGRMGINEGQLTAIENMPAERKRMETIREVFIAETGTVADAYEKLVEELTFTLFNRLAALKVMEAHTLHPEIVTRRESHGGRSFAHLAWLEQNPNARNEEAEGLLLFLEDQLQKLASDIPLFSTQHPYHLLPTALELQGIINAFNQVETDTQVETEIWKSDDVLGWLYESYNNYKKAAHKASGDKTEYNKVSIQSQVYTPRWVVQFLVDNSLGKLYLEMYPDSEIRNKYKIANAPTSQTRERKPLHEIRMIDPSTGSGNYLLYGFDMYYDLYIDQIENYGADYDEADVPKLIIENNLHGVDLDDRAIQLAQLGLYIKAKRKKRTAKIEHFNIVSSDFFLPAYNDVKDIFEDGNVGERERKIIEDLWEDLQNAHKFGSLIRLEEKLNLKWFGTKDKNDPNQVTLFGQQNLEDYANFRNAFFTNLQKAVAQNTAKQGQTFLNTKTQDAITFLQLLTQKYDVAVANPPYTDSAD